MAIAPTVATSLLSTFCAATDFLVEPTGYMIILRPKVFRSASGTTPLPVPVPTLNQFPRFAFASVCVSLRHFACLLWLCVFRCVLQARLLFKARYLVPCSLCGLNTQVCDDA